MIKSFLVHPAATSSTRGRLQRNAVVLILTLAFICAVFLSTHRILASAPTSSSTDEHHKLKLITPISESDLSRVDVFPFDRNIEGRVLSSGTDVITTVAGDGNNYYGGDTGLATSAQLSSLHGVAVDASGNVYIADTRNHRIRMVTNPGNSGIISTVAGNGEYGYSGDEGLAISAQLNYPHGVAVDASGNIYIADSENHLIRMVTNPGTSGIISTVAGNGQMGYSGDEELATLARLNFPYSVAVDASGNVYIADFGNHRIRMVTNPGNSGIISTVAGNGGSGYSGDEGLATLAQLSFPYGVAADASGNVYIGDTGNHRIRKVTNPGSFGMISTVAGDGTEGFSGDEEQATLARLSFPYGVAADASGNVYIADTGNHRIRKVTNPGSSGMISTVAGDGTAGFSGDEEQATLAQLVNPFGVCLDALGNIYIGDTGNNRVRKVGDRTFPTASPSPSPTESPSPSPTESPSPSPTASPSPSPTESPSPSPTALPSASPTASPSPSPTVSTVFPTPSCETKSPISPSSRPTKMPVTAKPTKMPVTVKPTKMPVTEKPTKMPVTAKPTKMPVKC